MGNFAPNPNISSGHPKRIGSTTAPPLKRSIEDDPPEPPLAPQASVPG